MYQNNIKNPPKQIKQDPLGGAGLDTLTWAIGNKNNCRYPGEEDGISPSSSFGPRSQLSSEVKEVRRRCDSWKGQTSIYGCESTSMPGTTGFGHVLFFSLYH